MFIFIILITNVVTILSITVVIELLYFLFDFNHFNFIFMLVMYYFEDFFFNFYKNRNTTFFCIFIKFFKICWIEFINKYRKLI